MNQKCSSGDISLCMKMQKKSNSNKMSSDIKWKSLPRTLCEECVCVYIQVSLNETVVIILYCEINCMHLMLLLSCIYRTEMFVLDPLM